MAGSSAVVGASPRLVIIGLDGASWELMEPLLEQGRLPAIRSVMEQGGWGTLRSVIPSLTGPAWASILTGREPGGHGIFGMTTVDDRRPGLERPVGLGDLRAAPLWEMLNAHGLTAGFLGVPFTYPPAPLDGWMVSGIMGTPACDDSMCRPRSLFAELTKVAGPCPLDPVVFSYGRAPLARVRAQVAWLKQAALYLLAHHPVDVFMVVASYADHVAHSMIRTRTVVEHGQTVDVVDLAYEAADELVGAIRAAVAADCPIVLVSDHGSGPYLGEINLEAALGARAQTSRRWSLTGMAWRTVSPLIPDRMKQRLRRKIGSVPRAAKLIPYGEATLSVVDERIRVSAPDERRREQTIAEVIEKLRAATDPDSGRPLLQVMRGTDLYGPPYGELAADIIVVAAEEGRVVGCLGDLPLVPTEAQLARRRKRLRLRWLEGIHRMDGIFATSRRVLGPDGSERPLPTWLPEVCAYCLRLCLGDGVDAEGIIAAAGARGGGESYTVEQQELVEKRLEDLGYM